MGKGYCLCYHFAASPLHIHVFVCASRQSWTLNISPRPTIPMLGFASRRHWKDAGRGRAFSSWLRGAHLVGLRLGACPAFQQVLTEVASLLGSFPWQFCSGMSPVKCLLLDYFSSTLSGSLWRLHSEAPPRGRLPPALPRAGF